MQVMAGRDGQSVSRVLHQAPRRCELTDDVGYREQPSDQDAPTFAPEPVEAAPTQFGANGDAAGLATVTGPRIDVQFSSATGGIGQLAGLPVMVISVPVLTTAAGRTVAVSATSPDASVSIAGGSVTVRGTLSVEKIPAGMGVVAGSTVVPVYGTGFTASTTVTIDGVEIAFTRFISTKEVDVTSAEPRSWWANWHGSRRAAWSSIISAFSQTIR
jgi:hypothetical protein